MPPQAKDRCSKATKTHQQKKKLRTQYQTYQDDKDKSLPNGKLQVAFSCFERGHSVRSVADRFGIPKYVVDYI